MALTSACRYRRIDNDDRQDWTIFGAASRLPATSHLKGGPKWDER
jgi:hypothetical protein